MILSLDVGNSQIFGGVHSENDEKVKFTFRKTSQGGSSSDEFGLFLVNVLRENGVDPRTIRQIALCSVVPDAIHSIRGACSKYFGVEPFVLQAGTRTGLKIKYRNPLEVGADRIANAIAGTHLFPDRHLIIADFGTATTFDVVNREREYLGGMILPGLRISMEALETRTAKLPAVEIRQPEELVGRSTVESIQSGLYYGSLSAIRGLTTMIRESAFSGEPVTVIGTGGFSRMFEKEFDRLVPDLVLLGLYRFLKMNT